VGGGGPKRGDPEGVSRTLSIAVGRYDRTQALLDGRVGVEGCTVRIESPPLNQVFRRAFDEGAWDVAELSCSNFLYLTAEGRCRYVGLPVFPSRMFRHSAIYVAADRGIDQPAQLAGRVVGVREYSMTAALVARGMLQDEYGLAAGAMRWRCGPLDAGDAKPLIRVRPPGIELEMVADGTTLADLLLEGKVDALIAHRPPKPFVEGDRRIVRLFADPARVEQASYARTGIFPIMHILGIRRELAADAALCLAVCNAFERARRLALEELHAHDALPVSLPWLEYDYARAVAALGEDYWPYGLRRNRDALEALARYSTEQGIASRMCAPEELLAPATHTWSP
jgi:4,5-dihydroxyphthalate decarboxylase